MGEMKIGFDLAHYPELLKQLQNIRGWAWCDVIRLRHMPFYENYLSYLQDKFGHLAEFHCTDTGHKTECIPKPPRVASPIPAEFYQQMRLKRYSKNTQTTYASVLTKFLLHWKNIDAKEISEQQIREHMVFIVDKKKCSAAYQRQVINALKLYYTSVTNKPLSEQVVTSPRQNKVLPVVLNEDEIRKLLQQVSNLKHKAMSYCLYSAGLRRSELLGLKICDIDSKRQCIMVRAAKGRKDRMTLLSKKYLIILRKYYQVYKPKKFLFEGARGGPYSTTSLRKVFYRALLASEIKKSQITYIAPLIRNALVGTWNRFKVHPVTSWAFKFKNHRNIYSHNNERVRWNKLTSG